jgi:sulfatase modifying factor 1
MHNIKKSIKYLIIFLLVLPIKVFSYENNKINFGKIKMSLIY